MAIVNIFDAKNSLSRLIANALNGEEVIIANRGKPVVKLVPVSDEVKSTGAALARWFALNPPTGISDVDLNERIREAREGWE